VIANPKISQLNLYVGGVYQQATSVTTVTNQNCYDLTGGCYSVYGFEVSTPLIQISIIETMIAFIGASINPGSMTP
jgi:hypothetical protein